MKCLKIITLFMLFLVLSMPLSFALSISNIEVTAEKDSAKITFETDIASNGRVKYGTTTPNTLSSSTTSKTNHEINLFNLDSEQTYKFEVHANDGTLTTDNNSNNYYSFYTKDDDSPSRVTGLSLVAKKHDYIELSWTKNTEDDIEKYYIYRDDFNIAQTNLTNYKDEDLDAETSYRYKVSAVDISGNEGQTSIIREFRTTEQDFTSPSISDIQIKGLSQNHALITWNTDELANSKINYGLDNSLGTEISKNNYTLAHSIEMSNLTNNTLYYYRLSSCDEDNNCINSLLKNIETGEDSTPPFIEVDIPFWYNSDKLSLNGKTEPFSLLSIYINGDMKRALPIDQTGNFEFSGISLDKNLEKNIVRLVAVDQVGFQNWTESEIYLDLIPPEFLSLTEFNKYTTEESTILEGEVSEKVTLDIEVIHGQETPPPAVTDLSVVKTEDNSVDLTWNEVENAQGYLIYRNGQRLTDYEDNFFTDPALNKSTEYEYQVSAYNTACIEGQKSNKVKITTNNEGLVVDDFIDNQQEFCNSIQEYHIDNLEGKFSQSLELQQGQNKVKITATDIAGNTITKELETFVDYEELVILDTNLEDISPSYSQGVKITGQVTQKPGQQVVVTVFVNSKPYSTVADENGNFEVEVELERRTIDDVNPSPTYDPGEETTNAIFETGMEWWNKIEIVAEAESGLKSETVEGVIKYAICGHGSWFRVNLDQASPSTLNPRLMLEGLGQFGIPVELKWFSTSRNATITSVDVSTNRPLSEQDQGKYDDDWVKTQYMTVGDNKHGYILIDVNQLEGNFDGEWTTIDMENNLSDHRKGECNKIPGLGCLRVPLLLDIEFTQTKNNPRFGEEQFEVEIQHQKTCIDAFIAIDRRIDPDVIPEGFLRGLIDLLGGTIDAIDAIVEPLTTITEVTFYVCGASMLLDFVMAFRESYACDVGAITSSISGEGEWEIEQAKTGQCEEVEDLESKNACQSCSDAILDRRNFNQKITWVCDRLFCPSVPSFQKYAEDMFRKFGHKEEESRSHCANIKYNNTLRYEDMEEIYDDYKELDNDEENKCEGLNPSDPECCAYEYMQEWNPACLGMNELKESKCLALEYDPSVRDHPDPDCTGPEKILSGVSDVFNLCSDGNNTPTQPIRVNDRFNNSDSLIGGQQGSIAGTQDEHRVWFRFLNIDQRTTYVGEAQPNVVYAEIGKILTRTKNVDSSWEQGDDSLIGSDTVFRPLNNFGDDNLFQIDLTEFDPSKPGFKGEIRKDFVTKYNKALKRPETSQKANTIYRDLQFQIGIVADDYIVDPSSDIIRSFQCVCLPGITSYLNLWKKVMEMLKLCFETVLATGDGSAGACKALLSQYVCDLILSLLDCFQDKFSTGTLNREINQGIGGVFNSLTTAGDNVWDRVQNRYGDSSMFESIFVEHQLVQSICLFAFTGTWDFDIEAILQEDISIDIDTIAEAVTCTRRYIRQNPASPQTPGLTTYTYHTAAAVIAGSDIGYSVELICSNDYSCEGQACDCLDVGVQSRQLNMGSGYLQRGDTLSEEVFENIVDGRVRYDKIKITIESEDPSKNKIVTCDIDDIGDKPPSFCEMDEVEQAFRCAPDWEINDYIRFAEKPKLNKNLFYPLKDNEEITLFYKMAQSQPPEVASQSNAVEFNDYTKYMVWSVYNQNKALIAGGDSTKPFNGNGIHEEDLTLTGEFDINDFLQGTKNVNVAVDKNAFIRQKESTSKELKYSNYIITLDANNDIKSIIGGGNQLDKKDFKIIRKVERDSVNEIILENGALVIYTMKKSEEVKIRVTSSSSQGKCDANTKRWEIHLEFFNAGDTPGIRSTQPATWGNVPVKEVIPFNVRCAAPLDLDYGSCDIGKVNVPECICGDTQKCQLGKWCNIKADEAGNTITKCEDDPPKDSPPASKVDIADKYLVASTRATIDDRSKSSFIKKKLDYTTNEKDSGPQTTIDYRSFTLNFKLTGGPLTSDIKVFKDGSLFDGCAPDCVKLETDDMYFRTLDTTHVFPVSGGEALFEIKYKEKLVAKFRVTYSPDGKEHIYMKNIGDVSTTDDLMLIGIYRDGIQVQAMGKYLQRGKFYIFETDTEYNTYMIDNVYSDVLDHYDVDEQKFDAGYEFYITDTLFNPLARVIGMDYGNVHAIQISKSEFNKIQPIVEGTVIK